MLVEGLNLLVEGELNNFIFSIGFKCEKSSALKWL